MICRLALAWEPIWNKTKKTSPKCNLGFHCMCVPLTQKLEKKGRLRNARHYHCPGSVGTAPGIASAMNTDVTRGAQEKQPEVVGFCQSFLSFLSSWLPPSPRCLMETSPNSPSLFCPCEFVIPVLYLLPK